MLRRAVQILGCVTLLWLTPWPRAQAAVVSYFPFTGRLTDASGNPLNNSALPITVRFFDAAMGGTELWAQGYIVQVTAGRFAVNIGSDTAAVSPTPSARGALLNPALFDGPSFLEVQVSADPPMTPRLTVGAMAYAMRASVAEDVECAGCVSSGEVAFNYADSTGAGGAASDLACSGCVALGSETSGAYDSTADSIADDGVISDSEASDVLTIDNGLLYAPTTGSMGIGTTSPTAKLDVQDIGSRGVVIGNVSASFTSSLIAQTGIIASGSSSNSTNQGAYLGIYNGLASVNGIAGGGAAHPPLALFAGGAERVRIETNGNVGIGTTTPSRALDVSGDAAVSGSLSAGSFSLAALYINSSGNLGINAVPANSGGYSITLPNNVNLYGKGIANQWATYSSRRFKTDIRPIETPLDKLQNLRGVRYKWKESGKADIGFIAEEVGQVLPEVVNYEANGVDASGMDYGRIAPLLVEAIKAQQKELASQQQRVRELEAANARSQQRLTNLEATFAALSRDGS